MSIRYSVILTCFAWISLASVAWADTYKSPIDKDAWSTESSKRLCTLSHAIPGYGVATFSQKAGTTLEFFLEASLGRRSATPVIIVDAPADWKTTASSNRKQLAEIKAATGKRPIHLTKMTPYQMISALAEGREPRIEFQRSNDSIPKNKVTSKDKDIIILATSGFQNAYKKYLTCVDELVAYPFDTIKKSTIYFESGSKALDEETMIKLDALAEHITHDENVYRIDLTGHSDSKGGYMSNRQTANERMWKVKDYLVYQGVDPELFTLKGFGDRMPVASNKTAEGRAKNRRVELKVFR
ncbi:OmpA family protein [Candidatus Berkiella cookevillensis]|uniref:OmpA family protein n=1 Tax=Candidatus Berkiella cookevillensis TaxID=437022 RepID=A0A0Q9YF75_9GAMM|nr:OmpA family protein [Candidatus Berkiella cookevillensis]MCS5708841.1 OmpA family protein [Candidatus Berkiella cookevillensis]